MASFGVDFGFVRTTVSQPSFGDRKRLRFKGIKSELLKLAYMLHVQDIVYHMFHMGQNSALVVSEKERTCNVS
jgi:hypothetical protein